jgi:SAM-dependent methyltransferase
MAKHSGPSVAVTVADDYVAVLRRYIDLRAGEARQLALRSDLVQVPCTLCGSVVAGMAFLRDGFTFNVCHSCESIFASPRPPRRILESRAVESPANVFWRTHLFPRLALMRDIPGQNVLIVQDVLSRHPPPGPVRVVDIGAGDGGLLRRLMELQRVERVIGIEPDRELVEAARRTGFQVVASRIEEIVEGSVDADIATCFDLIEHAYDPIGFLCACARTIRPGGYLLITAPNAQSLAFMTLWDRSTSVFPPDHINIPTSSGIRRAAEKAGLRVVEVHTVGRGELQALRVAMRSDEQARIPRSVRALLQMPPAAAELLEESLSAGGMASRVVCLAQRTVEAGRRGNRFSN